MKTEELRPELRIALLMATELLKRDNRENTAAALEAFVVGLSDERRQALWTLDAIAKHLGLEDLSALSEDPSVCLLPLQRLSTIVERYIKDPPLSPISAFKDHACRFCVSDGEAVRDDFVCGRHSALELLRKAGAQ